ncbi:MAG: tetratricopeptide repeat protein [Sphingobacteriaceae bacterium]|nr:tetratricopeptide repeat protein [Sphingobacteriaceae bacterium]
MAKVLNLHAQNEGKATIDSLKNVINNSKHDTSAIQSLLHLGELVYLQNMDSALILWQKAYNIANTNINKSKINHEEQKLFKSFMATSLNNIGFFYKSNGNITAALEYYNKSLKIHEELGEKFGIAYTLNNIGTIYQSKGEIPRALIYYDKCLKLREEIGDSIGITMSLNNISQVYQSQGDVQNAIIYLKRGLKLAEEMGDKKGTAAILSNMGVFYHKQNDVAAAKEYYIKSLKVKEEIGDKRGVATAFNNLGGILNGQDSLSKALEFFNKSLRIREELGDKEGVAHSLTNIGRVYLKQKNYNMATKLVLKAMEISKELGYPENIRISAGLLKKIYVTTGNYKLALENYELFIKMRDSINNETTRKASIKSQLKYEYEKQAAADSVAHAKDSEIKNAELAKQKAEISAKQNQQYALFGGLALVMIFTGFMYNRFKVTQKQKGIIERQKLEVESQKHLVEEKQREILDSIHYARRIQMAQIPSEKRVETTLNRLKK